MKRKKLSKKHLPKKVEVRNKVYFPKPKNDYPTLYLGADVSINHCGLVLLDNRFRAAAITDLAKPPIEYQEYGNICKLDTNDCKSSQLGFRLSRSLLIKDTYNKLFEYLFSEYDNFNLKLFIEGYAYGSKGTIFEIAEISQTFKMSIHEWCELWPHFNSFELYTIPPMTLKKFITGNGHATKDDIKNKLYEKYNLDLTEYDCNLKSSHISEDLNDAFALAKFGSEFDKWQFGEQNECSNFFSSLKEETILGFRR